MSRFEESMSFGGEALMEQCSDLMEYWPGGVEDEALEIDVIWTGLTRAEAGSERHTMEGARAEAQIWADAERGVEAPVLKSDVILVGTARWTVMELIETVGGLHRLAMEREARAVVGRARGGRRASRRNYE